MPEVYDTMPSPIGELLLIGGDEGLTGIYFEQYRHGRRPGADWRHARQGPAPAAAVLAEARAQLDAYFTGRLTTFALPLAARGTPFQQRVWGELRGIGFGEVISYAELARRIDAPRSVRAAGGANARNPLCIVVPCHRVVGVHGSLTGFGGGIERKRWLLRHESAACALGHWCTAGPEVS